jgi:DNA-directed RNA polymerase specialized sigma24 family protein
VESSRSSTRSQLAFDDAAERLVGGPAGHDHDSPAVGAQDYEVITTTLLRFLRGLRVPPHDAEEIVSELLTELLGRRVDGTLGTVRYPGAYLFWTSRNRAIDRIRRSQQRPNESIELLDQSGARRYSSDDDVFVRTLESHATAATVEAALTAAAAAGDHTVVRVVTIWLDLAEEWGREPTSREVAPEAGTSHTTVNTALRRFRTYLDPETGPVG